MLPFIRAGLTSSEAYNLAVFEAMEREVTR
jgi:hypothetical protein